MKTKTIAIFFSMMFATLTIAPDIIMLMDQDYDVSLILESGEEEERNKGEEKDRKKGEEKVKDFEIEQPYKLRFCSEYFSTLKKNVSNLHIDNYSSIVKELSSPPPERNII